MKTKYFQNLLLAIAAVSAFAFTAGNVSAQEPTTAAQPAAASQPAPQLSYGVPQVLQLAQAKVSDGIIVNYIQNSGTIYSLKADEHVYQQLRVSTGILDGHAIGRDLQQLAPDHDEYLQHLLAAAEYDLEGRDYAASAAGARVGAQLAVYCAGEERPQDYGLSIPAAIAVHGKPGGEHLLGAGQRVRGRAGEGTRAGPVDTTDRGQSEAVADWDAGAAGCGEFGFRRSDGQASTGGVAVEPGVSAVDYEAGDCTEPGRPRADQCAGDSDGPGGTGPIAGSGYVAGRAGGGD